MPAAASVVTSLTTGKANRSEGGETPGITPRRQRQHQSPVKALMQRFADAEALHMSSPAGSDIAFDLRGVNGLGQYGCAAMYGCSANSMRSPSLRKGHVGDVAGHRHGVLRESLKSRPIPTPVSTGLQARVQQDHEGPEVLISRLE